MTFDDIPADTPGVPWAEWHEQQIERIFADAREKWKEEPSQAKSARADHAEQIDSSGQPACSHRRDEPLLGIAPYDE